MIAGKMKFGLGLGLLIAFTVVLVLIFSPLLQGKNALQYLDDLYNSISKGSAYYIPDVQKEVKAFSKGQVSFALGTADAAQAEQMAKLFRSAGSSVTVAGTQVKVEGDLAQILGNCLGDSDAMYHNQGTQISGKYGYDERRALYNWWVACREMDKELKNQKKFKEAKLVTLVSNKAVETSYNYYKIQPQKIMDRLGTVLFSLFFYVVYTLWYGFAIMYLFEGWGMRLGH
jgi:hypothetical protein